jgi:signal recognition particle subunit SRP54
VIDLLFVTFFRVAATKSPILFTGHGEHMEDLDSFNAEGFVRKLLGLGDPTIFKEMSATVDPSKTKEMVTTTLAGKSTLRTYKEWLQMAQNMGPMSKMLEAMPGMTQLAPMLQGRDLNANFKSKLVIMDSLTDKELDMSDPIKVQSRLHRIARGSGKSIQEVEEFFNQFKLFLTMTDPRNVKGDPHRNMRGMGSLMNPNMLRQLGGQMNPNIMNNLMNSFRGMKK